MLLRVEVKLKSRKKTTVQIALLGPPGVRVSARTPSCLGIAPSLAGLTKTAGRSGGLMDVHAFGKRV